MKKVLFLLLSLLIIPIVYAKENVFIEKIELVSKSENVVINNEPTFEGLEMNYDIFFKLLNDSVKYKVTVKNDTEEDYKISNETMFSDSNYLKYEYKTNEELKANSSIDVIVTITYNREIPSNKFIGGKYRETNKAVVQLETDTGEKVNPKTSTGTIIAVLIIIAILSALILFKNKKSVFALVLVVCSIPLIAKAVESLKLTINVSVSIQRTYKVNYLYVEYRVLLKDEELKDYDLSYSTCKVLYINEKTESNKYNYCYGDIIKPDKNRYASGERVELKKIKNRTIDSTLNILDDNCEEQSDGTYLCDNDFEIEEDDNDYWEYWRIQNSHYGNYSEYIVNPTDRDIMNFDGLRNDAWDYHEEWQALLQLDTPNHFTMPEHDVTFLSPVCSHNEC